MACSQDPEAFQLVSAAFANAALRSMTLLIHGGAEAGQNMRVTLIAPSANINISTSNICRPVDQNWHSSQEHSCRAYRCVCQEVVAFRQHFSEKMSYELSQERNPAINKIR